MILSRETTSIITLLRLPLVLLALCLAAPLSGQEQKLKLTFEETSMGRLPAGTKPEQIVFSGDGKHLAFPVKNAKTGLVMFDGTPTKEFEWVMPGTLALSRGGGHYAFGVQEADGMYIVADGTPLKKYAEVGAPAWSPDGARLVYPARLTPASKGKVLIEGDKASKEYDEVAAQTVAFSRDGKRMAFSAKSGDKLFWVVDGQEGPPFDLVSPLEFSRDGSRFAYAGARGGKYVAMIDGVAGPAYDRVGGFEFSADAKRVAFVAVNGKRLLAVIDGKEQSDHEMISEPRFSADGKRVAYIAKDGRSGCVIVNGQAQKSYDAVFESAFSADGKHLLSHVAVEEKQMLVLDGKELKAYDRIGTMAISEDGAHLAYAAKLGDKELMVIDGRECEGPGGLNMSPDGRFVVHMLDRGTASVLMVNGVEGKAYDGFLFRSRFAFDGANTVYAMAGVKGELMRVKVKMELE